METKKSAARSQTSNITYLRIVINLVGTSPSIIGPALFAFATTLPPPLHARGASLA
jgi:hypothetical protein